MKLNRHEKIVKLSKQYRDWLIKQSDEKIEFEWEYAIWRKQRKNKKKIKLSISNATQYPDTGIIRIGKQYYTYKKSKYE